MNTVQSDKYAEAEVFEGRLFGKGTGMNSVLSYNMDHPRRGVAAIFNNDVFDDHQGPQRKGSENDCSTLLRTFNGLGFEVEIYRNLSLADFKDRLNELRGRDYSDCDCFVLTFMSHGIHGKLRSRDTEFDINLLWDMFTSEACPSLANKPKVFIIQACQGYDRQGSVNVYTANKSLDGKEYVKLMPSYQLPRGPDFLIVLSSMPGFTSWRSPTQGSLYIVTLCRHLDVHGYNQDMLTLLTRASHIMALYNSYYDTRTNTVRKQLPSFISSLLRRLKFTRKPLKCRRNKRILRSMEELSSDAEEDSGRPRSVMGRLHVRGSK